MRSWHFHSDVTYISNYDAITVISHQCSKNLTPWGIIAWQNCDLAQMFSYHISEWCMSDTHASKLEQWLHGRIDLSYFKTDTDCSRRNIINQGIWGYWIWDIDYWTSHKKPLLWVSNNTSKLQKTVRDCVRLWCHGVRIVWANCDVTVWGHFDVMEWDLGKVIPVMSLWHQCDASIWSHCEHILWPLHEVCVRSLWCHGVRKLLTGLTLPPK